jgi:hypothetical protein
MEPHFTQETEISRHVHVDIKEGGGTKAVIIPI